MEIRKIHLMLIISLVLFTGILPKEAYAAKGDDGGGLASAFETIQDLFGFVPEMVTLDALLGGDKAALFWAKFLIWLLLFAVLYFGASFVFKQNPRIAVIVALALSLISALMIPNQIVVNIFQTYGILAGILVWVIPVAAGLWLNHQIKQPALKVLIYIGMLLILFSIDATISKHFRETWGEAGRWFDYFRLLIAFVVIALIWNLFSWGWGSAGQQGARDAAGRWLGGAWGNARDWAGQVPEHGLFGRGREPRTPEEEQRLVDEAQNVRERIEALEEQLARNLRTADERQLLAELANLIRQLDDVQTQLRRLERI